MKLWIITACLNERNQIEKHLNFLNYICQTYEINYVIADGGSTDGSLDIIKSLITPSSILIENCGSIYESWNTAIKHIKQKFTHLIFLGVNDTISLNYIYEIKNGYSFDLLFSGIIIDEKKYPIKLKKEVINLLSSYTACMPIHHCGTVFSQRLIEQIGMFSTNYRISSDLDWMLKLKKIENLRIYAWTNYGVFMKGNGISSASKNSMIILKEELLIAIKNNLLPCPKRSLFLIYSFLLNFFYKTYKCKN